MITTEIPSTRRAGSSGHDIQTLGNKGWKTKGQIRSMVEHRWGCQGMNRRVIPEKSTVTSLCWGADVDFKFWYKLHSKCRLLALCDPLTGAGCKNLMLRFEAISLVARAVRAFRKIQGFKFQNFQQTALHNERCVTRTVTSYRSQMAFHKQHCKKCILFFLAR